MLMNSSADVVTKFVELTEELAAGDRVAVFSQSKMMISDDFKRLSLGRDGRTNTSRSHQTHMGCRAEM